MKWLYSCAFFLFCQQSLADNIVINGTRFIYPGDAREITVQLSNKADRPALAQVWIDDGNAALTPEQISVPFVITPPVARLEANGGQTVRVHFQGAQLPQDRESLYWLNVLDIPPAPTDSAEDNYVQLAIRSRLKLFYRPAGLPNRTQAVQQMMWKAVPGGVRIDNPTPFYITVTEIFPEAGDESLSHDANMIAPFSQQHVSLDTPLSAGQKIRFMNINDYGSSNSSMAVVE